MKEKLYNIKKINFANIHSHFKMKDKEDSLGHFGPFLGFQFLKKIFDFIITFRIFNKNAVFHTNLNLIDDIKTFCLKCDILTSV